jgi:pyruvate/2-oxoglutarate/acetoin dehydrogenase E1 component
VGIAQEMARDERVMLIGEDIGCASATRADATMTDSHLH